MRCRVAVDISGGDKSPSEIFKGAVLAQREYGHEIVLIGDQKEIEQEARRERVSLDAFSVVDAPEKISMEESAAISIRRKRKSSIVLGLKMLRRKEIDAFVSCGNTGAVVSAATLFVRLIEGVERPGISLLVPTMNGVSLLIDVGANLTPKPIHLIQYGVMASVYYAIVLDKANPTVGLLNVGEEESKGSGFIKTTHKFFSSSPLNFIGNIEARDIFAGRSDCVVCDGFVGNVVLKLSEGLSDVLGKFFLKVAKKDFWGKLGLLLLKRSFIDFKKIVSYEEYGGAPLLGVNGVVVIGHGRSNRTAVKNAIRVAQEEVQRDLIAKIHERLEDLNQTFVQDSSR